MLHLLYPMVIVCTPGLIVIEHAYVLLPCVIQEGILLETTMSQLLDPYVIPHGDVMYSWFDCYRACLCAAAQYDTRRDIVGDYSVTAAVRQNIVMLGQALIAWYSCRL